VILVDSDVISMCSASTSPTENRAGRCAAIAETVEADMDGATYAVSSADVLRLAGKADHPTYDCEYVALAQ